MERKKYKFRRPGSWFFITEKKNSRTDRFLKLSELYAVKEEVPKLEMEILMLNVNQGHNPELMEACHTLSGVCGIYRSGEKVCQRPAHCGGGRACYYRVHSGRGLKGVLGEESQGGEEREYL